MVALAPLRPALNVDADAERRSAAVRNWRRRSQVVAAVRRFLPVLMAAVVLGLGGWLYLQSRQTTAPAPSGPVAIRMINPTFQGRDDGRPFILQAREATRDGRDAARIALIDPRMEIQDKPGDPPTRITAQSGIYREDTLILDLQGDVRYSDGQGWRFLTRNAVVDTRKDVVRGQQGIKGEGPSGLFKADRYVIYNLGDRVILSGNVQTQSDSQ